MISTMTRARISEQEIADFRDKNGEGRTGFVFTKDTIDASARGDDGGPHPYTLDRIGASCFAMHATDSGRTVDLWVQCNSMRLKREGPGLVLKRQS